MTLRVKEGRTLWSKVGGVLVQLWPPLNKNFTWSGRTWKIRTGKALSPGPNDFGGTSKNVAVEADGRLRLSIAQVGGVWTSAEVHDTAGGLGYGRYKWVYDMDVVGMDWKPVLGLFTYDDDPASSPHFREIDIETTKWNWVGEPSRQWYSVHPTVSVLESRTGPIEPRMGEHSMSAATPYTGEFVWQPGLVYFRTLDANGVILGEHVVTEGVQAPGTETVRMNLWLIDGNAPTNGQPVNVFLRSFDFTPGATYTQKKAAFFVDSFDDPWGWSLRGGAAIEGGALVMPSKVGYAAATSGSLVDIRESSTLIEVLDFPAGIGGYSQEALWFLRHDHDNFILFFYSAGGLYVRTRQQGVQQQIQIPAFDPAVHRWWSIAHSGSTFTFSTSPDGASWTVRGTIPATMTTSVLSTLRHRMESGVYGGAADESTPFRVGRIGLPGDDFGFDLDTDGEPYITTAAEAKYWPGVDTDGEFYLSSRPTTLTLKYDTDGEPYAAPKNGI